MKKISKYLLLVTILLLFTACGTDEPEVVDEIQTQNRALKAEITEPNLENDSLQGDTYWSAYKIDEMGNIRNLPDDSLWIDLTLREDGTAQYRNVIKDFIFANRDFLNMTWKVDENQQIALYMHDDEEPWFTGKADGEEMTIQYFNDTIFLKKSEMPTSVGELYCPFQLGGVWLMESGENEGDEWNAQPGYSESMIFQVVWEEDGAHMVSLGESRDHTGELREGYEAVPLELMNEPLYNSCENEKWSVLVGARSELNEDGHPLEPEKYVTLLDEDTMLCQNYFTIDGGPGVSYQTFKRVSDSLQPWEYVVEDLEGGDYECIGYVDANGVEHAYPPEMEKFSVHLDIAPYCSISWWDNTLDDRKTFDGIWVLGEGGVINLISEDYYFEEEFTETCWFAGALEQEFVGDWDHADYDLYMNLCYKGGIIKLKHSAGSGGENYGGDFPDYEETMSYLEGTAFSAPEDTLFVIYGDEFLDMDEYLFLPFYEISTSENARRVLITAVIDNTYFWYVDKNGEEVWSETLNAGESVILQIDIPKQTKEKLWLNVNNEAAYSYEINQNNIVFGESYYITE